MGSARSGEAGFSLVEALVAMVIVAFGVLAMAASTGYVFNQLRFSGRETERTMAVQTVVEEIRSMAYADVQNLAQADARTVHGYSIWWTVETVAANLKQVELISEGPGYLSGGRWSTADQDTFMISVLEP